MESLVAMLVLSAGIGALAWTQARQLADGRDTTARSMAVLLTDDLANRMLFNRAAAAGGQYELAWDDHPGPTDCTSAPCTGAELASADLAAWREALAQALPGSNARVFMLSPDARQIGIVIAWRAGAVAAPTDQMAAFAGTAQADLSCPTDSHCHVTYVPI